MKRRLLPWLSLLLVLLLPLSSCGSSLSEEEKALQYEQAQGEKRMSGTLRLPLKQLPGSWIPDRRLSETERFLLSQVSEGLTNFTAQGRVRLLEAETCESNEDRTQWTLKLRSDLKWSDGSPLTAEDYRRSWLERLAPGSRSPVAVAYLIKGAQAYHRGQGKVEDLGIVVKENQLEITLEAPFARFDAWLSDPFFYPSKTTAEGKRLFNGPFLPGDDFEKIPELHKNANYWDAPNVHLERVAFTLVEDGIAAYEQYRSGLFDLIGEPVYPLARERREEASKAPEHLLFPTSTVGYFQLEPEAHPLFQEAERRRLLYEMLDPAFLTAAILFDESPVFPERHTVASEVLQRARHDLQETVDKKTLESWKETPLVGLAGPELTEYRLLVASTKEWLAVLRLRLFLRRLPREGEVPALRYETCTVPSGVAGDWALLLPAGAVPDGDFRALPGTAAILPLHLRQALLLCPARVQGAYVTPTGLLPLSELQLSA